MFCRIHLPVGVRLFQFGVERDECGLGAGVGVGAESPGGSAVGGAGVVVDAAAECCAGVCAEAEVSWVEMECEFPGCFDEVGEEVFVLVVGEGVPAWFDDAGAEGFGVCDVVEW